MVPFYGYANHSITILNSVVEYLRCDANSQLVAEHCVIRNLGEWPVVRNSIVFQPHDNSDANPLYNSIYCRGTNCRKVGCWQVGSYEDWYRWSDSPFTRVDYINRATLMGYDYSYVLKDDAAATYIGSDGTQVGLYGGTLGFTETPSSPQIVEAEVPREVDDHGQLHVRFKVEPQK